MTPAKPVKVTDGTHTWDTTTDSPEFFKLPGDEDNTYSLHSVYRALKKLIKPVSVVSDSTTKDAIKVESIPAENLLDAIQTLSAPTSKKTLTKAVKTQTGPSETPYRQEILTALSESTLHTNTKSGLLELTKLSPYHLDKGLKLLEEDGSIISKKVKGRLTYILVPKT